MTLKELSELNRSSIAMVDVAKAILEEREEVMEFNDILSEIAEFLDLSDEEIDEGIVQFYTDLNTNGGFISLGDNRWGLRQWYPIDSIDEELTYKNDEDDETPRIFDEDFEAEDIEEEEEDRDTDFEDPDYDDDPQPVKADFFDANAEAQYLDDGFIDEDEEAAQELSEYEDDLEELDVEEDDDDFEGEEDAFDDEE